MNENVEEEGMSLEVEDDEAEVGNDEEDGIEEDEAEVDSVDEDDGKAGGEWVLEDMSESCC